MRRAIVNGEINSTEIELGSLQPLVWPADAGEAIAQKDYQQRLLGFTFRNHSQQAIEDVAITFDFFSELGDRHTILGVFAHGKDEQEVIFDRLEPDYLYDIKVGPNGADQIFATTGGSPARAPEKSFSATVAGQMVSFIRLETPER